MISLINYIKGTWPSFENKTDAIIVWSAILIAFGPILLFTLTKRWLTRYGTKQIFPNKTIVLHELAASRSVLNPNKLNRVFHALATSGCFIFLVSLVEST